MSLYGLDFIVDKNNHPWLIEINGHASGMKGFERVYQDKRVQNKVVDMLKEKYGQLIYDNGVYDQILHNLAHPFRTKFLNLFPKIKKKLAIYNNIKQLPKSDKAILFWIKEVNLGATDELTPMWKKYDIPVYTGEMEGTVINSTNKLHPLPTINHHIAEHLTRNKLLQHIILHQGNSSEHIPQGTTLGMGFENILEIEQLLKKNNSYMLKPLILAGGAGIHRISHDDLKYQLRELEKNEFKEIIQGIDTILQNEISFFSKKIKSHIYEDTVEDMVQKDDFKFELGIMFLQEYIQSKQKVKYGQNMQGVIRAIVCNGKFVDAYQRFAENDKHNYKQGVFFEKCEDSGVAKLSEDLIKELEQKSKDLFPQTFKKDIYNSFIEQREDKDTQEYGTFAFTLNILSSKAKI